MSDGVNRVPKETSPEMQEAWLSGIAWKQITVFPDSQNGVYYGFMAGMAAPLPPQNEVCACDKSYHVLPDQYGIWNMTNLGEISNFVM